MQCTIHMTHYSHKIEAVLAHIQAHPAFAKHRCQVESRWAASTSQANGTQPERTAMRAFLRNPLQASRAWVERNKSMHELLAQIHAIYRNITTYPFLCTLQP